jgi:hypothetical protein
MVATHSSGRIDGAAIPQLAPELVQAVRKKRLVAKVLQDDTWIRDISLSLSLCVGPICSALDQALSCSSRYVVSSAYKAFFSRAVWRPGHGHPS